MATITNEVKTQFGKRDTKPVDWVGTPDLRMGVAKVVFGAGENYVTGGIDIKTGILAALNMNTVHAVIEGNHDAAGLVVRYNASDGKLLFYESGTADAPLDELNSASALINSKIVFCFVIGS